MSGYRILCVDGGGVRGVYAAKLLARLVEAEPALVDAVDLLAGSSTGAIIALGLARGLAPDALVTLYRRYVRTIFSRRDDRGGGDASCCAAYDVDGLLAMLERLFGDLRLRDLPKRVLVPAFDLDPGASGSPRRWKPKLFHNFPGSGSDAEQRVVDVAVRSAVAPTYFPTYQGYVDGGVFANNPSMCALAQALDASTGRQQLERVRLFSLGTGIGPRAIEGDRLDWGASQWAQPLVELMIEGAVDAVDYQCRRLLGSRYQRLAPVLLETIALDDVQRVPDLLRYAEAESLDAMAEWLHDVFLAEAFPAV